jgi:ankyrin repeat protein
MLNLRVLNLLCSLLVCTNAGWFFSTTESEFLQSCVDGDISVVNSWLDNSGSANVKDQFGYTPIMIASYKGKKDIVERLIKAKADVNAKNEFGFTALMRASNSGHEEVAKLLVKAKADINLRDEDGMTALMNAAWNGHKKIVKILIDANANLNLRNNVGRTALEEAEEYEQKEIVKLLKNAGADNKKKKKKRKSNKSKDRKRKNTSINLLKFLKKNNLEQYHQGLLLEGYDELKDILNCNDDDFKASGIKKTGHRKRLLAAIAKFVKREKSNDDPNELTDIVLEIVAMIRKGDGYMTNVKMECEKANVEYQKASDLAKKELFFDLAAEIDWKIFKAETCLSIPHDNMDSKGNDGTKCTIDELFDEDMKADFNQMSNGQFLNVKHHAKWYALFGIEKSKCSARIVKRAWRKLQLKYHPDKYDGDKDCAREMSLMVNAAKELLEKQSACKGGFRKRGDL